MLHLSGVIGRLLRMLEYQATPERTGTTSPGRSPCANEQVGSSMSLRPVVSARRREDPVAGRRLQARHRRRARVPGDPHRRAHRPQGRRGGLPRSVDAALHRRWRFRDGRRTHPGGALRRRRRGAGQPTTSNVDDGAVLARRRSHSTPEPAEVVRISEGRAAVGSGEPRGGVRGRSPRLLAGIIRGD